MTDANHLDILLLTTEQLTHRLRLRLYRACRSLLHQDVTILPMLKGKQHQVHSLLERHDKSRHLRLRQRNRVALTNLLNPQRDDTSARAHHITIACAANLRVATVTTLRHGNLLLDGLRDTHRIDRIRRLVRRQTDDALHPRVDGSVQRVVRSDDVRLHRLHREELTARHLLQRSSMEHIVHPFHRILQRALVTHVANVEFHFVRHLRHTRLEVVAHVVLLLFITREDTNLPDVRSQKTVQHGIAERPRAASNQQRLVLKY